MELINVKMRFLKFLLHIFGGLSGLGLTASKRTFHKNSLTAFLMAFFVFSLLRYTAYTATYLVSGTDVAVLGGFITIVLVIRNIAIERLYNG